MERDNSLMMETEEKSFSVGLGEAVWCDGRIQGAVTQVFPYCKLTVGP